MYKINSNYAEFISKRETIKPELKNKGLILKFLWKNPEEKTICAVKRRPVFHLYYKAEIMFLLIKFKDLDWVDVPCVFSNTARALFSYEKDRFPCKILLANSNTGKLFVNKTYIMPKGVSKAFIQGVHLQKSMPKKEIRERINKIRAAYSADEMLILSFGKIR